jgi:hypothetical protein
VNIVRNGSRLLLRRDAVQPMLTCMRQPSLREWKSCELTTRRERLVFYLQGRRQDNGSYFIEVRSRLSVDALSDSFRPEVNSAVDGGEVIALGGFIEGLERRQER